MSGKRSPPPAAKPVAPPDLEAVNVRLRKLVTSLRGEQARLEARAMTPVPVRPPAEPPAGAPSAAERRLAAELESAREQAREAQAERDRLQARLDEVEAEHRRISDEYVVVLEQTTDVARRYVALERIHGGVGRDDTLAAIHEVVVNLVGSEEYGLYERRGDRLELVHSFGLDRERWASLEVGKGAVGRAARTGAIYVAGREGQPPAEEADLSAVVPLRAGDEVPAVLAIFRLLGHKPVLDEQDQAVFDLLATHAGVALQLRAHAGRNGMA
ncbi:MAG TPA: GAF domain-containing protein [Anaeromyxobacteraceae bacterium]|nr:GAF domain-containing protein [Anaeromyxobacteraceae bacterium]